MDLKSVRVAGVDMLVRPGTWDENIAREVIQGDCYRVGAWSPPNPVVIFDVGGHIGSFSRWMATRLPHARVFTFEMDEANVEVCKANLGELPNVILTHGAMGPRSGDVVRGPVHRENTGGGHVDWDETGDGVRVPAVGIADFLASCDVPYIDCLKLDCEGSEFSIVDSLVALPGGLHRWVGSLRAELHALDGSPEYVKIVDQLNAAFPFVTVSPTSSKHQHYLFAWR
jgi:FkbM family methyltransferase